MKTVSGIVYASLENGFNRHMWRSDMMLYVVLMNFPPARALRRIRATQFLMIKVFHKMHMCSQCVKWIAQNFDTFNSRETNHWMMWILWMIYILATICSNVHLYYAAMIFKILWTNVNFTIPTIQMPDNRICWMATMILWKWIFFFFSSYCSEHFQ